MKSLVNLRMIRTEPLGHCKHEVCQGVCCAYGVWVDQIEIQDIPSHADRISQQLPPGQADTRDWFDNRPEPEEYAISRMVEHRSMTPSPEHDQGTA